jgi:hypothetical protein
MEPLFVLMELLDDLDDMVLDSAIVDLDRSPDYFRSGEITIYPLRSPLVPALPFVF